MAENVTNELLLEHMKAIQAKLSVHDERFTGIENDLRAMKAHMMGLVQSDLNRDHDYSTIYARLDRIERRLDIVD